MAEFWHNGYILSIKAVNVVELTVYFSPLIKLALEIKKIGFRSH